MDVKEETQMPNEWRSEPRFMDCLSPALRDPCSNGIPTHADSLFSPREAEAGKRILAGILVFIARRDVASMVRMR